MDAQALWGSVFSKVGALSRDDVIRCFFFLRKPPGLRLRFALDERRQVAAVAAIRALLDDLVGQGLVTRWFPSVYEPEVFKFGGTDAIDAVHAYFSADSTGWWRWEQLCASGEPSIDRRLLSVAVLNDLFSTFTDGPEEVWDVWCRVATLHGDRVRLDGPPAPTVSIGDIVDRMSSSEADVLRGYASCNAELVHRFRALHAAGKLLFAYRLVLPHVAIYHWSRFGFTPDERSSMYTRMMRAWSPHG